MQKHSKILVAGATGLVGGAIVRQLLERGFTNIIGSYHSKDSSSIYASRLMPHALRFTKIDFTRQEDTETLFKKQRPEYVFLAAAKVGGILANNTYPAEFIYENIMISANVIHCSYKYGVKKLLNLGSSCIYPKYSPQPMKEEHLLTGSLEPTNEPYAIAKISAIKLVRYYNEQYGTNFLSIMPTNLYGPNDNFNLETSHVLPALIRKFHLAKCLQQEDFDAIVKDFKKYPIGFGLDNKVNFNDKQSIIETLKAIGIHHSPITSNVSLTVWGTGEVYREFLHVDDMADASVYLMENINAWDLSKNHPFNLEGKTVNVEPLEDYFLNIGTGKDIKLKDLAEMIKEIVGFKGEIVFDPSKPDGTPRKLLDVSKIKALGWEGKISLEEGIKRVYEWYVER